MKLAIISDTHFGDDNCTLVTQSLTPGIKYDAFRQAAGQGNDFLVLAGDVFDFSIAPYDKAYRCGQAFFRQIMGDNIARKIIYIPGNHDADIWHIVQHQKSVINKLMNDRMPEPYEHSIAGIIDDREASPCRGVILDKTTARTETDDDKYGGMFLDRITKPATVFYFVYPNLYIVTDQESVLVTHGQYLEPYWSILGEVSTEVAFDDLKVGEVDIEETIEMNYPLNQLACTGIGQAGVLTTVIRQVQTDVNSGRCERIEKYLRRLEKFMEKMTECSWWKKWLYHVLLKKGKEVVVDAVRGIGATRYSEDFVYKRETQERFRRFYNASLIEIGGINKRMNCSIPAPWRIIFGHTHQRIPWNAPNPPRLGTVSSASPRQITLHNTGGWLMEKDAFCGAEVFLYETGKGFYSSPIL